MGGPRDLHLHLHPDMGSSWGLCDLLSAVVALASQCGGWLPVRSWELLRWKDPGVVVQAVPCFVQGSWEQKPPYEGKAVRRAATRPQGWLRGGWCGRTRKGLGWGVLFVQHRQAGAGRCGATGLGDAVGATAWQMSAGTWRWAVSPEWFSHAEIAGTAPNVKPSLASPNWEQLLTTHRSPRKGQGSRERRWAVGQPVPASILVLGLKTC